MMVGSGASESATTRRRLLDKTPDHRLVTVTLAKTRDKARADSGDVLAPQGPPAVRAESGDSADPREGPG